MIRREVWYAALADLLDDAGTDVKETTSGTDGAALLNGVLGTLSTDTVEVGTEAQRGERARALSAVVRAGKRGVFGGAGMGELAGRVEGLASGERSLVVKEALKKVMGEF